MLLKTIAVVLSIFLIVMLTVIAFSNPELIQLNLKSPHTTEKYSNEVTITDPEMVFILAAMFLTGAIILGILLIVVALKISST